MFSTSPIAATRLIGSPREAIVAAAARAAAPPAISHFIVSIDSEGLSDRPPESNVTPLPTRARSSAAADWRFPWYLRITSRGGRELPRPTARIARQRSARSRSSSQISISRPVRPAIVAASAANVSGYRSSGGVLTSRRARFTPSAIAVPELTSAGARPTQAVVPNGVRRRSARYRSCPVIPTAAPATACSASVADQPASPRNATRPRGRPAKCRAAVAAAR